MTSWRETRSCDIPRVVQVADCVHPELPEDASVFAERARIFPEGSLVLVDENDTIHGYGVSHPVRHAQPPALNSLLGEIAADADQYYIHDIAILPEMRGLGHAAEVVGRLLKVAERFKWTCLVSVYGTGAFWVRFGFDVEEVDEAMREKGRGYGDDAVYMRRRNGSAGMKW